MSVMPFFMAFHPGVLPVKPVFQSFMLDVVIFYQALDFLD
jgi:hypothetical protein